MLAVGCVPAGFIALDQGFRIDAPLMRDDDDEHELNEPGRGRVRAIGRMNETERASDRPM